MFRDEVPTITYEQLIAAALLNYKACINLQDMSELMTFFIQTTDGQGQIIDAPLKRISKYIDCKNFEIKLKDEFSFDMQLLKNESFRLKDRLAIIAGDVALSYVELFATKGCINCTNKKCRVPNYEKTGFNEEHLPEGNNCSRWSNNQYKTMVLTKKFK